jgi:hypothetical protein
MGMWLVAGCGAQHAGARESDHYEIISGTALGPVRIGELRKHVEGTLHDGVELRRQAVRAGDGTVAWTAYEVRYAGSGVSVIYAKADSAAPRVIAVETQSPRYASRSGVRVGESLSAIRKKTPIQCINQDSGPLGGRRTTLCFTDRPETAGVVLQVTNGAVARILVVAKPGSKLAAMFPQSGTMDIVP